ncbi:helix-turn-helix domain-containing protein [Roseibium sp.]|uniref:helix-turn-helix domain-containing protein n=1 Tax=Roseibium sp. TaxID=1936156 RepID=UPI003BAB317F
MTVSAKRPRMSMIPAEAVTDPAVSLTALKVLTALGRHTDRAGFCFRSLRKLAVELDMARSTIQRAIAQLISAGWLIRFRKQRGDGGDCSSHFRVMMRRLKRAACGELEQPDDGFETPENPSYAPAGAQAVMALEGGDALPETSEPADVRRSGSGKDPDPQPGGPPASSPKNGPIKTSIGYEANTGQESKPAESVFVAEVKRRLQKFGWICSPAWFVHGDQPIRVWFWTGCDIDRDVMPVICQLLTRGGGRPHSLNYFTKAIFRQRNSRLEIEGFSPMDPSFLATHAAKKRAELASYRKALEELDADIAAGVL